MKNRTLCFIIYWVSTSQLESSGQEARFLCSSMTEEKPNSHLQVIPTLRVNLPELESPRYLLTLLERIRLSGMLFPSAQNRQRKITGIFFSFACSQTSATILPFLSRIHSSVSSSILSHFKLCTIPFDGNSESDAKKRNGFIL